MKGYFRGATVMAGKCKYIACIALFLTLLLAGQAQAVTVAVFPVDDLSAKPTAANSQAVTELLAGELAKRGLTVVSQEKVLDFMRDNRIRQLGMLSSQDITAAGRDLGVDAVLVGSLCQQNDKAAALGLTVSLLRASDGRTIWASSKGMSLVDEQRLLKRQAPSSLAEVQPLLLAELFSGWPDDLDTLSRQARRPRIQAAEVETETPLDIDSVFFNPKRVQPGQEVSCTIRFKLKNDAAQTRVFIRVGNRIHVATTSDGVYYQVSWVGSDDKVGKPVQVAMNDPQPQILNGMWSGAKQDADYPVSLIVEWPSGKRVESYVGSYVVDSLPPAVQLKARGKEVKGSVAFRAEVPIKVLFKRAEPVSQWEFAITTPEGEIVTADKGNGQPPADFSWRGLDNKGGRALPGQYVAHLKVWDQAQNVGQAQAKVLLLPQVPGANLTLSDEQAPLVATLKPLDELPIVYWRLEMWSEDNVRLQSFEGQTLPAKIVLPDMAAARRQGTIGGVLKVRDAMGVQASKKLPNLLAQVAQPQAAVQGGAVAAPPPVSAQDGWQVDF